MCVHFVTCPKQGLEIEAVVLHRVGFLAYFCPKQGQDFKPSSAPLYPNMGQVPPPGTSRVGHQMHHVRRTCRTRACSMEKQTVARSGFSLVWRRRNHCSQGNFSVPYQRFVQADATFTPLENKVWLANARGNYWILYHKTNKEASTCAVFCCKALRKR